MVAKSKVTYGMRNRYQNLLHVTLYYNKYTVKQFFDIVEKEGIDMDPDDLIDGGDFSGEFYEKLVKDAKEKLYPFRDSAKLEPETISVVKEKKEKSSESLYWKVSRALYPVYDAPRRMACGMKPFDIPEIPKFKILDRNKKSKDIEKDRKDDAEKASVETKEGNEVTTTEVTIKEEPVQQKPTKVFTPVNGVGSIDVDYNIHKIILYIKENVEKGTIINVLYNNTAGSYVATLTFKDGKTNSFTIDMNVFLPDYIGIVITDPKYGTLSVPFEYKKCIKDLVNTPMYKVPEKVVEDILNKYYFDDIGIYYAFDLSSVKGIKDMPKREKKKFEKILTNLKETLRDQNVDDVPRFRISKWNSVNDFQITSDELCRTPFYYNKETSGWIAHTTFDIKDGKAIMVNQPNAVEQQTVA